MDSTENIRCLIVDDEYPARVLIEEYLSKIPGMELIASCPSAIEALSFLESGNIDLLFLDINMPGLSGLDLIRSLNKKPIVILTTAYTDYALESYELEVCDYLVKPIRFERFLRSTNKARESAFLQRKPTEYRDSEQKKDHLFVTADHKLVKIRFSEILFIEGLKEYVRIHTSDRRIVTLATLKSLETELPEEGFIRVHKSWIVAINKIDAINGNTLEIGNHQIPIGGNYKAAVMALID